MSPDPRQIDRFAERLVGRLDDLEPFQVDPAAAITERFGLTVHYRSDIDGDCDIDGSYNHERRIITIADAASPGRRRFTALHELAHALGRADEELQDWLFPQPDLGRLAEERVANAFAAEVLLPKATVDAYIPDEGPTAYDTVALSEASTASREAVCVRASQRLRAPGLVALARGSVIRFAAVRGLPFGVRRDTDQDDNSLFGRAARAGSARENGVRIRFPDTDVLSSTLLGDAQRDADGYVFAVLMEHSAPWAPLTPVSEGPEGHEIDCPECDRTRIVYAAPCRRCGDRPCPDHGCSCDTRTAPRSTRRCTVCNLQLPAGAPAEVDLCDMHR